MSEQHEAELVELAEHHQDALMDTNEAYSQFHGWVLNCLWCEHSGRGATKREALARLQHHYDQLPNVNAVLR